MLFWSGKADFYDFYDFSLQFTTTKCSLNEQIHYCSSLEGRKEPKCPNHEPLPIALGPYSFLVLDEDYRYGFHVSCTDIVSILF